MDVATINKKFGEKTVRVWFVSEGCDIFWEGKITEIDVFKETVTLEGKTFVKCVHVGDIAHIEEAFNQQG